MNITFGRFNPYTKGHEYLFSHLPSNSIIMVMKTHDKIKNWFTAEQRIIWMKQIRNDLQFKIVDNPFKGMEEIINDYDSFNLIVGEDRKELVEKLQKYFSEKSINIQYMPRYQNISATQVRKTLSENNFNEFSKLVDKKIAMQIWDEYHAIRNNWISTNTINESSTKCIKSSS